MLLDGVVHAKRGRWVGLGALIGIGVILPARCVIGSRCIIAAGTAVTPGTIVADNSVMMGVPERGVREVAEQDEETIDQAVCRCIELGPKHAAGRYPNIAAP